MLLPSPIAHCGIAAFALADFDVHADNLRIPPVRAGLVYCMRAYSYEQLAGGTSIDIVLLSCPVARCGAAVSAFTGFVLRANNLRIPPVRAVLVDSVLVCLRL